MNTAALPTMNLDFLAIGDTVVDEFIFLKEASVACDAQGNGCALSMRWGDKIPYEKAEHIAGVGNAANAAVSAARLGLTTGFVAHTGGDRLGDDIMEVFKNEGIDTTYVTRHRDIPTNHHYVLSFQSERTILIKHALYPRSFPRNIPTPKAVYLSSLGDGTEEYHDEVASYIEANPDTLFGFQPGIFEIRLGRERLARLYARADLFFCNVDEAGRILGVDTRDAKTLAAGIQALGPKTVVLTDGPQGAYAFTSDGTFSHTPIYPDPAPPVERTGAGDAFSSTTAIYVSQGYSLPEAMKRGAINSAYVVQDIGAQRGLLTREKLEQLANAWNT